MKAFLFKTDGSKKEVKPKNGKEFSLAEMYGLIGCAVVEHVWLQDSEGDTGVELWCDEEGLMKSNWIVNEVATAYYRKAYPRVDPSELVIVGNALIVDNTKAQTFFD